MLVSNCFLGMEELLTLSRMWDLSTIYLLISSLSFYVSNDQINDEIWIVGSALTVKWMIILSIWSQQHQVRSIIDKIIDVLFYSTSLVWHGKTHTEFRMEQLDWFGMIEWRCLSIRIWKTSFEILWRLIEASKYWKWSTQQSQILRRSRNVR